MTSSECPRCRDLKSTWLLSQRCLQINLQPSYRSQSLQDLEFPAEQLREVQAELEQLRKSHINLGGRSSPETVLSRKTPFLQSRFRALSPNPSSSSHERTLADLSHSSPSATKSRLPNQPSREPCHPQDLQQKKRFKEERLRQVLLRDRGRTPSSSLRRPSRRWRPR